MPNKSGVVTGGKSIRGFNDNTVRGYSLWLPLSTRQVSDVVQLDEDILRPKGGRHVKDESDEIKDLEKRREAVRQVCALRYLDGYPDTKVIDAIKETSQRALCHASPQQYCVIGYMLQSTSLMWL